MQIGLSVNTTVINKALPVEMAALNHSMQPVYMTVDELAAHVQQGHPFTPAWLKTRSDGKAARNNASWVSARLVAIDIDNTVDSVTGKRRRNDEEGYVSLDDILRDENIRRQAAMIYTTSSHTDDHHKMRVVFVLPDLVTDADVYKRIVDAFIDRFNADTAASAIANLFYGSKDCTMHVLGNVCDRTFVEASVERMNAIQHETKQARMYIPSGVPPVEEIRKMLAVIPEKIEYLDWMRIVSAVGNSYPEDVAFDLIIAKWPEMSQGDVRYKLQRRLHRVGIGTLIYHAKRYGWNPPAGMYDDPPKPKEAIKAVEKYLAAFYRWRFNVVRNQVEYSSVDDIEGEWHNFDDYRMHSILRELRAENINVNKDRIVEIVTSDFSPKHDPIAEYFRDLPTWDNNDRFVSIAECIPIPEDDTDVEAARSYIYTVIGNWMISAVACSTTGKANHICPILQGPQGAYKTTFILGLCPPKLRRYLTVGTINNDKDTLDAIAGSFMYVDDELATMNRKEAEIMKRIITQEDIRFRQTYARFRSEHQRRASFIGSVNKVMFLNDETGSRRFPVIRVGGNIDIEAFRSIDIDQVWAQAHHYYRTGTAHWFDQDTIEEINERNKAHQMTNEAEELLAKYCSPVPRDQQNAIGVETLMTSELAAKLAEKHFNDLKAVVRIDDRLQLNLGKALHSGGFVRIGKKKNGLVRYVWVVKWA